MTQQRKSQKNNNSHKKNNKSRAPPSLSQFTPVPPYRISLRFTCEPATDCTSLTGLSPKNLGLAVGVAFLNTDVYAIPANGVLAPTAVTVIPFRYMKILKSHFWGPTSGSSRFYLVTDTSSLTYPKPTKIAESRSVTNRPYDCISTKRPFPLVVNTTTSAVSSLYSINFVKSTVAGADNTVVLQIDCVVFS